MKINKELLENKKLDDLLREIKYLGIHAEGYFNIELFLKEHKVNTYYDLALLVNDREHFRELFVKMFFMAFDIFELEKFAYNYLASRVYMANKVNCNVIYDSRKIDFSFVDYIDYGYLDYEMFASTFEFTDKSNTINDLWLRNPLSNEKLPELSIYEAKKVLRSCSEMGSFEPLMNEGIDFNLCRILIKSLKPYTEQVIRQSIDLQEEGLNTNLLKVNRQEKIGFVYGELASIVEYLMYAKSYQGGEFIFGRFSNRELEQLKYIGGRIRGKHFNKKRGEFAEKLGDSFTLKEFREGIFIPSYDVLDDKCIGPNITRKLRQPISRLFQEK